MPDTGTQLTIPGVEVTPTGAVFTGPITPQLRLDAIAALLAVENTSNWILGDLVVADMEEHGLAEAALAYGSTDLDRARVAKCTAVARKFPHNLRYVDLSWSHHARVVNLSDHDAHIWLAAAVDNGWTVNEMWTHYRLDQEHNQPALDPRLTPLPKPPEALVRDFLADDPDAWVMWQPSTNRIAPGRPGNWRDEVAS
jgi:hypothetical protein